VQTFRGPSLTMKMGSGTKRTLRWQRLVHFVARARRVTRWRLVQASTTIDLCGSAPAVDWVWPQSHNKCTGTLAQEYLQWCRTIDATKTTSGYRD
jgi:hypothetical protein